MGKSQVEILLAEDRMDDAEKIDAMRKNNLANKLIHIVDGEGT